MTLFWIWPAAAKKDPFLNMTPSGKIWPFSESNPKCQRPEVSNFKKLPQTKIDTCFLEKLTLLRVNADSEKNHISSLRVRFRKGSYFVTKGQIQKRVIFCHWGSDSEKGHILPWGSDSEKGHISVTEGHIQKKVIFCHWGSYSEKGHIKEGSYFLPRR